MNEATKKAMEDYEEALRLHAEGLRELSVALGVAIIHFEKGRKILSRIDWS